MTLKKYFKKRRALKNEITNLEIRKSILRLEDEEAYEHLQHLVDSCREERAELRLFTSEKVKLLREISRLYDLKEKHRKIAKRRK
jgi:hypothetical protein